MVAKWVGIRVNEFAIGFGPKLFSFQKGETKYSLRLLPIGGFCSMEGEDENSSDERAYCNQSVWKRLLVCLAGAFNNIMLGFLLVTLLLTLSGRFGTTTVARFEEKATSNQGNGLQLEDKILEINDRKIFCVSDISYMLMNALGDSVSMTVERDGEKVELDSVKFKTEEIQGHNYISIDFKVQGEDVSFRNVFLVIKEAALETLSIARLVWMTLLDLLSGRYGLNEIMGPVGTISTVGQAAKAALSSLVYIMAMITVNLGVFNLLPIPALDGGRCLILLISGIIRKEIPAKYEAIIHGIGMILLLLFMAIVAGNDILRLIRGRMLL